jgi:hypothetical protein
MVMTTCHAVTMKRLGMLPTSVRKMKALNVKIRHPKNSVAGERD